MTKSKLEVSSAKKSSAVKRGEHNVRRLRRSYEPRFDPSLSRTLKGFALTEATYIVFDIETTGGNPERNGITELCALKFQRGEVIDRFYTMVNPKIKIPPIVRRMTGITDAMVRDAPTIERVMPDFLQFISDAVLVSHNTIGDLKFLRYFAWHCCRCDMQNFFLCTHLLVDKLHPEAPDKSLTGLARHFSLSSGDMHRADEDAEVTLSLFKLLKQNLLTRGLEYLDDAVRFQGDYESGTRLGWGVSQKNLADLPSLPGVLICKNRAGKPVFITSCDNLAKEARRLCRHGQLPRPVLRAVLQTYQLEYQEFNDPLAALLGEVAWPENELKKFRPHVWHQRYVLTLNFFAKGSKFKIECGVVNEGAVAVLGPVKDRKELLVRLTDIGNALGVETHRGTLEVDLPTMQALLAYFSGAIGDYIRQQERAACGVWSWLFWRRRKCAKTKLEVAKRVAELEPFNSVMEPLHHLSGVAVVPTKAGKWNLYTVRGGQIARRDYDKQDWQEFLSEEAKLKPDTKSCFEQLLTPLSYRQAAELRVIIWWMLAGHKRFGYVERVFSPKKQAKP